MTTWLGARAARPTARLDDTKVLPAPPLGEMTAMMRELSAAAGSAPTAARRRWTNSTVSLTAGANSRAMLSGGMTSRMPTAHRLRQQVGRGFGHQHDGQVGLVVLDGAGEADTFGDAGNRVR